MDNIKEVLDEAGIIYQSLNLPKKDKSKEVKLEAYLINLSINNAIISGGIVNGKWDKPVMILFYYNIKYIEERDGLLKVYEIINRFNQSCRYGSFTYDDGDIMYSLTIPIIERERISKEVFKYYFDRCLAIVKESFEELQNESWKNIYIHF